MERETGDTAGPGGEGREARLADVDPELNIFALANGMDLFRNRARPAERTLEWYREGLDRRIHLLAEEDPSGGVRCRMEVEASLARKGVLPRGRTEVVAEGSFEELRPRLRALLAEGVERANALEVDEG